MSRHYVFKKRVSYHETDAMGVVHHSNHVKYFEDARVAWMRDRGVMEHHSPYGPLTFAVVKLDCQYLKPARFDDELEVWLQAKLAGLRIHFQYAIHSPRLRAVIASGQTVLVPLSPDFKPTKLPEALARVFSREPWDEAWPPAPALD